jgi:hypothetical protein
MNNISRPLQSGRGWVEIVAFISVLSIRPSTFFLFPPFLGLILAFSD